jgi:hypothetical protein
MCQRKSGQRKAAQPRTCFQCHSYARYSHRNSLHR